MRDVPVSVNEQGTVPRKYHQYILVHSVQHQLTYMVGWLRISIRSTLIQPLDCEVEQTQHNTKHNTT